MQHTCKEEWQLERLSGSKARKQAFWHMKQELSHARQSTRVGLDGNLGTNKDKNDHKERVNMEKTM